MMMDSKTEDAPRFFYDAKPVGGHTLYKEGEDFLPETKEWMDREPSAEVQARLNAIRREAALIDPATAKVCSMDVERVDPYNFYDGRFPYEFQFCATGRFARRPESGVWVHWDDLPEETRKRLRERVDGPFLPTKDGGSIRVNDVIGVTVKDGVTIARRRKTVEVEVALECDLETAEQAIRANAPATLPGRPVLRVVPL
jgi:hypothetical protein